MPSGSLVIGAPVVEVFDYLSTPRCRPEWQSSLRRVEDVTPDEPGVGQTWIDVTAAGVRPRMETTEHDRPARWTERGSWGRFEAWLRLELEPADGGTRVRWSMELSATGPTSVVARVLGRAAPLAIAADLRRAGRLLENRQTR